MVESVNSTRAEGVTCMKAVEYQTPESYIEAQPEGRRVVLEKIRETIKTNLPVGFQETMQ